MKGGTGRPEGESRGPPAVFERPISDVLMPVLPKIASVILVLVLLGGVPALSFLTARDPKLRLLPRPVLYASAVLSQWILAGLAVLVTLWSGGHFRNLGWRAVPLSSLYWWAAFLIIATALGMVLLMLLEALRLWPGESDLVYLLLPRTGREKLWAVLAVAPTAAICEEFLYRGYLLGELAAWMHSLAWGWVLSSLAFGLAHMYQRGHGIVRAALLGALLAYPVLRLGSLYPSMLAHFVIDAVTFGWLGAALLRDEERSRLEAAQALAPAPAPKSSGEEKEAS